MHRKLFGFPVINFNTPEAAGGAGDTPAAVEPENVLFPAETPKVEADATAGEQKPEGSADWKEYTDDPAKSAEENAAAKAEHDKTKPAGDDKDKKPDAANEVPADGKYELTMPEGVEVDKELLDALSPKFAAKKLTRAEAQELADEFIKVQQQRGEGQVKAWGERVQKWADDAKADKEIGGDNWTGTVSNAQRFINTMGSPGLKEYLNASGGGNHPELIRIFAKAGALIKEDDPATGGAEGRGKPAEAAHLLFPNDAPKGN